MASGGVHLVSGFAIGAVSPSVATAFAAGVASHAALDAAPHRDFLELPIVAADAVAALTLVGLLTARLPRGARLPALAGAVGAVLPDTEVVAYRAGLWPAERKVFPSHTGRIRHGRGGLGWTFGLYALSTAAAFASVRRRRRRS